MDRWREGRIDCVQGGGGQSKAVKGKERGRLRKSGYTNEDNTTLSEAGKRREREERKRGRGERGDGRGRGRGRERELTTNNYNHTMSSEQMKKMTMEFRK